MEYYNITKTGLSRRVLIWVCLASAIIITLMSGLLNISDSVYDTFIFFLITLLSWIFGSKMNDTKQKKDLKIKEMEIGNGNK